MPRYTEDQYRQAISLLHLKSNINYSSAGSATFKCCFHSGDNTPSLSISFEKGIYHCFGCNKSGTVAQLVKEVSGSSIASLLGLEQGNINIFNPSPFMYDNSAVKKVVETYLDVRGVIVPFNTSKLCMDYLSKRYITPLIATKMNMKFAEDAYINGTRFFNRLLIPIYNEKQELVNMEGRDATFNQTLKCLYPKKAVKPLYEWYKLKKDKPLYLFEGLIKMAVARSDKFFENSSATLGSKVSDYQLEKLKEFKDVVLVPDNDDAGSVMVSFLKEKLLSLKVLRIRDKEIKDVDEIPDKTGLTIEQYREQGNGFVQDLSF